MIKQYFKQALAQLRQHPLISVISIAGTALSIFLIMLVVTASGVFNDLYISRAVRTLIGPLLVPSPQSL